mgnify:CR=1 FL=1
MPQGKGTYGNKVGRPSKKKKKAYIINAPKQGSKEYNDLLNSMYDKKGNRVYKPGEKEYIEKNKKNIKTKEEFNKISQSFDLIGKPTKLTRPGYAGGGKSKRR